MNCFNHPDVPAAAFCRSCGRPLCTACQRMVEGVVYCAEHAPVSAASASVPPPPPPPGAWSGAPAGGSAWTGTPAGAGWTEPPRPANDAANPYAVPPASAPFSAVPPAATGASPGLAFVLGLIPGVGAIYNGQYVKGLIHAAIFGMLITMSTHSPTEPIIGLSIAAFYFYMPFEAFHTARRRQMGMPVEEWSSLMGQKAPGSALPVGPIVLILIGVIFLLNSLNVLEMETILRFWPVLLILAGFAMLFGRIRTARVARSTPGGFENSIPETSRER